MATETNLALKIAKLANEYQKKIDVLDIQLDSIKDRIRKSRNLSGYDSILIELRVDQKLANTQRQCYVQFISDLNGELLDTL